MSVAGTIDAPLDLFGGLVTDLSAPDLPGGVSPDCQDVAFVVGAVKTRPGLFSFFSAIAGNPTVNYLKTFSQPNLTRQLLALDSTGKLWGEATPGTLTSIASMSAAIVRAKSDTLFGREYIGFSDGSFGIDIPRQYDGTNFDRVSQVGPGVGPFTQWNISTIARAANVVTVTLSAGSFFVLVGANVTIAGVTDASFNGTFPVASVIDTTHFTYAQVAGNATSSGGTATPVSAITDVVANITAAVRAANVVTITTATPHGVVAGDSVVIAGVTDASFNGTFPVATIPDSLHFTYAQVAGNAASAAGTAAPVGSIVAGVHQCAVIFVTRQGYLTKPSPPVSWTANGGRRANVTGIPSPASLSNIAYRILAFTGTGGATYFYTTGLNASPQMQVNDNTASSFVVDFTDVALLAGTSAQSLFQLIELGECAGALGYKSRLFWWGERNKQNNWVNLSFDGGFGGGLSAVPLGWTPDGGVFAGGGQDTTGKAIWGQAYAILGDGATATRGLITQSAVTDYLGAPLLLPNISYSVRVRVRMTGVLTQGTLHVHLYSASGAINTTGVQVTPGQITSTAWTEFIAVISSVGGFTTIPSDLVLRVYADGTPTNGVGFLVENIEIFPTSQPYNASNVRASRVNSPESYDGVTGFLQAAVDDGTAVRTGFVLRERLYFVKETSMHVTDGDAVNEPSSWTVNKVSGTVGTPSVMGADVGEDWAVILSQEGLFIFSGGEPTKISQEIQPLWDTINWAYGYTAWVKVDTRNKRILCGVPIGSATSPNQILVMDYRGLISSSQIIETPPVHFSSYNGKMVTLGLGRKWAPWKIAANSCTLSRRPDNTFQVFFGNAGAGNGKIYELLDTQFSDDGAAINSYYTTYFFLTHIEEQQYQVRAHRKLFAYLTMYVEGAGTLALTAYLDNVAIAMGLPSLTLYSPAIMDSEMTINVLAERVAFKVGTNAVSSWFKLERFIPSLAADPWSLVRGNN